MCVARIERICWLLAALAAASWAAPKPVDAEYQRRVKQVTRTRGFVALWDFVKREDSAGGQGRFDAHKGKGESHDLRLDAMNYVRDYWGEGREAGYRDIPLLGRGVRLVRRLRLLRKRKLTSGRAWSCREPGCRVQALM